MDREFDWDDTKSERNRRTRGFTFEYAARVFAGPTVEQVDMRRTYGEKRVVAIGKIDGELYTVVYTDRDGRRRIIAAWRTNRKERVRWPG